MSSGSPELQSLNRENRVFRLVSYLLMRPVSYRHLA
jgi:hypothetical protein